jgi:hypothetical protein
MTPAAARQINEAAYALARLCRRYRAPDDITSLAVNAARLSDAAVDAMAPETQEDAA